MKNETSAEDYAANIERMIDLRREGKSLKDGGERLPYLMGLHQGLYLAKLLSPATAKKKLFAELFEKVEEELFDAESQKEHP